MQLRVALLIAAVFCLAVSSAVPRPRSMWKARDGSTMLLIPAAAFWMGSDEAVGERPLHRVTLPDFYIAREAVTNAQFERFVKATHYQSSGRWKEYMRWWGRQAPVVDVTWYDAMAYCRWAKLRLPTEAEREKATRGTDARLYPWGNQFDADKCRCSVGYSAGAAGSAAAVGSYPSGASPYGVLDTAGNVWEWASTQYRPYPYRADDGRESTDGKAARVWRGSSWYCNLVFRLRASYRQKADPKAHMDATGFRCAADPP